MPERVFLVDGNNNINPPCQGNMKKGIIYLDDDKLPHHEYFDEENNGEATTEGSYVGSDDPYMSDDNGHRECGRGKYSDCPADNPERYFMSEQEEGDMTIIDVMNTNQRLRQDEGSETESSHSNR